MTTVNGHQNHPVMLWPASPPAELTAEHLRFHVALTADFRTTADLEPRRDFTGQERAQAALELGLGVANRSFHIFVSGLTGIDKLVALRDWATPHLAQAPTPGDWVYVHNFAHPDAPRAIALAAGRGHRLKFLMQALVKTLQEELPKALRQEAFDKEKAQLKKQYAARAQALVQQYIERIRAKGFLIEPGPGAGQYVVIPLVNGKPLTPETLANLREADREALEKNRLRVAEELDEFTAKQEEILRALAEDIHRIERHFCETLIAPFLAKISHEMESPAVNDYLAAVKTHILDHLDTFTEAGYAGSALPFPPSDQPREPFLEYDVNVVVDNTDTKGAPVLVETAPTYLNLFGSIERVVDPFGRLVTNFTRIKSGALLRASGGYVIFNLEDALMEFGVWKTLKRTLKSGRVEMETYGPFALFAIAGIKPEPIEIQTTVIVVGSSFLYHLLYRWDDEFREIFKVHADFRPTMELEAEHLLAYGQWLAQVCRQEGLPPCDRSAVERFVEFGARQAEDRHKVSASYAEITDVAREAAYWARKDESQVVLARHVQKALSERVFRSNRIEEEIRELITQGTILVEIDGRQVGRVNGLSVLQVGDHRFARPARVTASVAMGQAGIVNIERESHLSSASHDKGLLILAGYVRNCYGQDKPLTLSASLCFEQSYAAAEGDSASLAELSALLSRLADLPLRQDIAVTGSVNQWGEVQAVSGVNEKIEGFFEVCRVRGLTGHQGVLIPAANVRNLILRTEVIEAVARGTFHLYPIRTADEGVEVLTGVRAGTVEEAGTVNWLVNQRLHALAVGLKAFLPRGQAEDRHTPADTTGDRED